MRKITIATVSFEITRTPQDGAARLEQAAGYILDAAAHGADIVCLPETVTTYHTTEPEAFETYSELSLGAWSRFFSELAAQHTIAIVAPYFVRESGRIYNQATVFDKRGKIAGRYRKLQPTGREALRVTQGSELPVIDLGFARIAVMICMDLYFAEIARIYAMKGAEILFFPTITHGPTQSGLEMQVRVRAMDNSLVVVESNLSQQPPYAPYLGRFYPGTARIIDHNGDILAHTGRRPGIAYAEIDLDQERRTLDCFLIEPEDHTRRDIEALVRLDLYSKEYAALAKNQQRYYDRTHPNDENT